MYVDCSYLNSCEIKLHVTFFCCFAQRLNNLEDIHAFEENTILNCMYTCLMPGLFICTTSWITAGTIIQLYYLVMFMVTLYFDSTL